MKIFYGMNIEEPEGLILDLMRLVLEPNYFRKSHITLRGPYNESPKKTTKWLNKEITEIYLGPAGQFSSPKQNTVFFSCISEQVKKLSWKRDYPDAVSHITIYDGEDRDFAQEVFAVASQNKDLLVPLRTSQFVQLSKKKMYETDLLFMLEKASYIYESVFDKEIKYDYLNSLNKQKRLEQFKALYFALNDVSQRYKDSITKYQAIA